MNVHDIARPLKRILPELLFSPLRRAGTALVTPIRFSYSTGHFRSSLLARAVDVAGDVVPWYTFPMVDLLSNKQFHNKRVLEFGAGQSTQWWASRAESVLSLEDDQAWYESLLANKPGNVTLKLVTGASFADDLTDEYDVIIIDGMDRLACAKQCVNRLRPEGAIILDNAEGFWGKDGTFPIMDLFRSAAFQRVDFYGFAPGVSLRHCTSLFFKDRCFLFQGTENPSRLQ